jgi:hypothetical protein
MVQPRYGIVSASSQRYTKTMGKIIYIILASIGNQPLEIKELILNALFLD